MTIRRIVSIVALTLALGVPTAAGQQQAAPSPDFEFFKSRVEPIFLKKRPSHARCYICHEVESGGNGGGHCIPPGEAVAREHLLERGAIPSKLRSCLTAGNSRRTDVKLAFEASARSGRGRRYLPRRRQAICIPERPGLADAGRVGPRAKSRRCSRQVTDGREEIGKSPGVPFPAHSRVAPTWRYARAPPRPGCESPLSDSSHR